MFFNPAWRFLALFCLVFLLLILRRPDAVLHSQFWAEDSIIFFYGQVTSPGLGILFQPYAGYLHIVPRLIAAFAVVFSAGSIPLVMNLCALWIAAFCCSLFSLNRYRYLLESDWLRIAVCLVIACAFQAVEFLGNITCVHCFLLIAALLILLQPPDAYRGRHAWAAYLAVAGALLAGLSDAAVLLLLPIAAWMAVRRKGRALVAPAAIILAALVQIGVFLHEPTHAARESLGQILVGTIATLADRVVLASLFGVETAKSWAAQNSTLTLLLTVIALTMWLTSLWWHGERERRWKMAIGSYLAIGSVLLALAGRGLGAYFYRPDGVIAWNAERYFFTAACLFAYLVALSIERWMPKRKMAQALIFAAIFAVGTGQNFYQPARFMTDCQWQRYAPLVDQWIRAKRAGRASEALSIPVNPVPWKLELPRNN